MVLDSRSTLKLSWILYKKILLCLRQILPTLKSLSLVPVVSGTKQYVLLREGKSLSDVNIVV